METENAIKGGDKSQNQEGKEEEDPGRGDFLWRVGL